MKEESDAPQDALHDDEFLRRARRCELERFNHRDHLRVAFTLAQRDSRPERIAAGCREVIRKMAAAHGEPDHYHETVTTAWALIVSELAASSCTFSEMLDARPEVGSKGYLLRFYSRARLLSPEARVRWVAPDIAELAAIG